MPCNLPRAPSRSGLSALDQQVAAQPTSAAWAGRSASDGLRWSRRHWRHCRVASWAMRPRRSSAQHGAARAAGAAAPWWCAGHHAMYTYTPLRPSANTRDGSSSRTRVAVVVQPRVHALQVLTAIFEGYDRLIQPSEQCALSARANPGKDCLHFSTFGSLSITFFTLLTSH